MVDNPSKKYWIIAILMLIFTASIFTYLLIKFLNKSETTIEVEPTASSSTESNYEFETDWWLKPQTYTYKGELDYHTTRNYNVVWWGEGLTSPENIQGKIKDEIEQYHAQGIKYIVPISLINIEDQIDLSVIQEINDEMIDAVVQKLNGDPQILMYGFGGNPDIIQYAYDINHTKWRDYIIEQAKAAVDAGADGISIDDISGNVQWVEMGLGSFNIASESKFAQYLKEKYSPNELSELGITDIEIFDYSNFLTQKGWTVDTLTSNSYPPHADFPLYNDFSDFQEISTAEFVNHLISTIKAYAQEKYARQMMFTECCEYRDHAAKYIKPYFDLLTAGAMYGKERTYQHIVAYKLGVAASGSPMVAWLGDTEAHFTQQDITDLNNIYIAESYANQAQLVGHPGDSNPKQYNDFIHTHSDIFNFADWESKARIGILYTLTTMTDEEFYGLTHTLFFNLGQLLVDSNYQFDIIFSHGDDLDADQLSKYEVIILPETYLLLEEEKDSLLTYATNGGQLIYIGEKTSPFTTQETLQNNIIQNADWVRTCDLYGQHIQYNTAINLTQAFPEFYTLLPEKPSTMNLTQTIDSFQNLITPSTKRITLDTDDKIRMVLWNSQEKVILHLINYDFDYSNKENRSKSNLEIKIDDSLISDPQKITIVSPDSQQDEEVDFNIEDSYITFIVPKLHIWDIVVIE